MEPVNIISGTAVPLDRSDVDTDQIIPSDWLKRVERTGFDAGLFGEWREEPGFVLNDESYAGASILVAGPNFGTGSSREHAVWAIQQYGFAAVISPRFGPIFVNNATKCGLVPVAVSDEVGAALLAAIAAQPDLHLTIDVDRRLLEVPMLDISESFPMADDIRHRLLNGLDDIGVTLGHAGAITDYEAARHLDAHHGMIIRHVTTRDRIEDALRDGQLRATSIESEGFVHCCTDSQLDGVLDRFYADRDDVVVVSIETDRLRPELRWEPPSRPDGRPATEAETSEEFPHVYGPINLDALTD